MLPEALREIENTSPLVLWGKVKTIVGLIIEVGGLSHGISVGARVILHNRSKKQIQAEVVGFKGDLALVMAYGLLEDIGPGCPVSWTGDRPQVFPHEKWLGRIVNGVGEALDNKGPLLPGPVAYGLKASPPPSFNRKPVGPRIDLGMRAINTFATCCRGQRMGVFAASGVGKSVLLSQFTRYTSSQIIVIGLIGERGREVNEFIEEHLGEEGLKRSVVVVATSDESSLMRRQAAYTTLAISEFFRDLGYDVLCLMDSVTRFAMALREIGLSVGEPPASKGYTPSVFAELPKLLERAGPGLKGTSGDITGLFTVLVEGDDHNEPVADAVRGILDGHLVLERSIGERGRYPAVNVLRSLSRMMPDCHDETERALVSQARKLLSAYEDMAEMIRLGAYQMGSNPLVDEAIHFYPALDEFLAQGKYDRYTLEEGFEHLQRILGA